MNKKRQLASNCLFLCTNTCGVKEAKMNDYSSVAPVRKEVNNNKDGSN